MSSAPLARWKDLCLDAHNPLLQGRFWAAALGLSVETPDGQVSLAGEHEHERVWVNAVDRVSTGFDHHGKRNRLHLDIHAASVADPEGGEFCCFVRDGGPVYRLHGISIDCVDPAAQAAWWGGVFGVEALLAAGATPLWDTEHWAVVADPEANEFCVFPAVRR